MPHAGKYRRVKNIYPHAPVRPVYLFVLDHVVGLLDCADVLNAVLKRLSVAVIQLAVLSFHLDMPETV